MVAVVPRRASKIELPGGPERVGVNGIWRYGQKHVPLSMLRAFVSTEIRFSS